MGLCLCASQFSMQIWAFKTPYIVQVCMHGMLMSVMDNDVACSTLEMPPLHTRTGTQRGMETCDRLQCDDTYLMSAQGTAALPAEGAVWQIDSVFPSGMLHPVAAFYSFWRVVKRVVGGLYTK